MIIGLLTISLVWLVGIHHIDKPRHNKDIDWLCRPVHSADSYWIL